MSFLVNSVHNMDCLEGIRKIPDHSVKTIIADPPYAQGMSTNGKRVKFEDLSMLKAFYQQLFEEFKRVLQDDGEIFWFSDFRGYAFYYPVFQDSIGVRNVIVWDKISGQGNFYGYTHEFILYHSVSTRINRGGRAVWPIPGFSNQRVRKLEGKQLHRAQKPLELMRKILTDSTSEGDLVLDPFSGSGTVAICAKEMDRKFIAFEHDQSTFLNSLERFKKVHPTSFVVAA